MFENQKSLLLQEKEAKKESAKFYIENSYLPTWPETEKIPRDSGLKVNSTAATWEAYQAGKITREKAVEMAVRRVCRRIEKEYRQELEGLDRASEAPELQSVQIRVEWKRSTMYGMNPHATVIINQVNRYEGKASGCGYDKLSAAIADALNKSAVAKRALYQAKEKAILEGKNPASNRECIAYGAGYGVLPYFEGGVGLISLVNVLQACGLKWKVCDERGGTVYNYYFERG